jgi:hypothetical protein
MLATPDMLERSRVSGFSIVVAELGREDVSLIVDSMSSKKETKGVAMEGGQCTSAGLHLQRLVIREEHCPSLTRCTRPIGGGHLYPTRLESSIGEINSWIKTRRNGD